MVLVYFFKVIDSGGLGERVYTCPVSNLIYALDVLKSVTMNATKFTLEMVVLF